MSADLFRVARRESAPGTAGDGLDPERCQYFTPTWAAEWLVQEFFPDLGPGDAVVEAGCGHGAFLGAIPADVPAIGVEIDPAVAAVARRNTGRRVIEGDFLTVDLPVIPTAIIGNPPFNEACVDGFLDRAHALLRQDGRVGWVLPAYVFQTPSRVLRMANRWSIAHRAHLPRTLYRGLSKPLVFVVFTKDGRRLLQGFALYREIAEVNELPAAYQRILQRAPKSAWVKCVVEALHRLGGRGTLQQIYAEISGARPTQTAWWREKVRQVVQRHAVRLDEATYGVAA
jgi:site-specific DNA-methyltransferase (adenine-specific)